MKLSLGLTPRDYSVSGGVTYDADAQAYFTANTAITSDADKNAINTFYLGLKSDGIYTKIKAMYLPIWGSASSSKWNLVNPLDTDAAYRLNFATGYTFSNSGMTPNGTSAFSNTFFQTNSIDINSLHFSVYSRTNTTSGTQSEFGSLKTSATVSYTDFSPNLSSLGAYARVNDGLAPTYVSNSNTTGFYIVSRTASNLKKIFKNGSVLQSLTTASTAKSLINNYLSAVNQNGTSTIYYSSRQQSFASIGDGLTDTEATNFHTRVNTLMTYFGINV